MLVKIFSGAVNGIEATTITLEVNILNGAKFIIVGLPDNAVKESQQRIDSALREIGSRIPGKRVIINMAPADVKKEGSAYDLPLCIGILAANEQLSPEGLENFMMLGELSLDGSLVAVKGVLPIAINARSEGFKSIIVPLENANEAAVVEGIHVYGFSHIREVTDFLNGKQQAEPFTFDPTLSEVTNDLLYDFKDVKGQETVKRALEIAAAGEISQIRRVAFNRLQFFLAVLGEDDACEAFTGNTPSDDCRRVAGNHKNSFRRGKTIPELFADYDPAFPFTPSYNLSDSPDRRRIFPSSR